MHQLACRLTVAFGIALAAALFASPVDARGGRERGGTSDHDSGRGHYDDGDRQPQDRYSGEKLDNWWQGLPEQEREHLRQRYEELPADRRGRIDERWQRFRDLPPEQQEQLRRHYQRWQELPPPERERLQRTWQHFRELPPDRQRQLKKELHELRKLPDDERERRRRELHRRYFPDLPPPPPHRER